MLPALLLPAISSIAPHIDLSGGSPRYEGGPLVSSVQQRLGLLKSGDPGAIAQTHQDAQSGGAGWKDVALVLAPAVRPDIFGAPSRALNATEQGIVGGNPSAATAGAPATAKAGATVGEQIATFFGFGPQQQAAAAKAAGSAAGSAVSKGLVEFGVILAVVIIGVVVIRKLL